MLLAYGVGTPVVRRPLIPTKFKKSMYHSQRRLKDYPDFKEVLRRPRPGQILRKPLAMVKSIPELNRRRIAPRVVGFDDTPFETRPRIPGSEVHAVGVITSADRFEGMLYCGEIEQDGLNAGERIEKLIRESKFHEQIHAVLIDGITMGGLNIIDINKLAKGLDRPVVAIMRSYPKIEEFRKAILKLPGADERNRRVDAAGPVHQMKGWTFQYRYPSETSEDVITPEQVATLLDRCTPEGTQKVPECLRIAHLIGAAIKTGQSSSAA